LNLTVQFEVLMGQSGFEAIQFLYLTCKFFNLSFQTTQLVIV